MEMKGRYLSARAPWIGAVILLSFSLSCATDRANTAKSSKESAAAQSSSTAAARFHPDQTKRDTGEGSTVSRALAAPASSDKPVVEVTGLQFQDRGPTGLTILVTADGVLADYESFMLPDPPRLVIDLPRARHAIPQPVALPSGSPILKIRTTQYRERPIPVVRLVFDLGHPLPYRLELIGNQMQILVSEESIAEGPATQGPRGQELKGVEPAKAEAPDAPVRSRDAMPSTPEVMTSSGEGLTPLPGEGKATKRAGEPPQVTTPPTEKVPPIAAGVSAQPVLSETPGVGEKASIPGTEKGTQDLVIARARAATAAPPERPVTEVTGVQVQAGAGGATILVTADGVLADYESFMLPDPPRLVIDLPRARHAIPQPVALPSGSPILKIRTTQYRERPIPVVRLVFDLDRSLPFGTERIQGGLKISIGEARELAPPPAVTGGPKKREIATAQPPTSRKSAPPASAKRPIPERRPVPAKEPPLITEVPVPPPSSERQVAPPPQGAPKAPIGNSRLSLDFKGADLDDLLRLISEVSGLNIVAAHNLKADDKRVTIRLTNVEWRQALDTILRAKDLSYEQDGNLIYVGTKSAIQKAKEDRIKDIQALELKKQQIEQAAKLKELRIEDERRKVDDAKRKSEEEAKRADEARKKAEEEDRLYAAEPQCTKLIQLAHTRAADVKKHLDPIKTRRGSVELDERTNTVIVNDVQSACLKMAAIAKELDAPPKDPFVTKLLPFNYAKAADLKTHFASLKTAQGSVVVDERSSRIIVKDLPQAVERMESFLKQIDIPTPQVLIEARIVEASRSFSQSLGIQWGGGSLLTTPGRSPVTLFGGNTNSITFPLPQAPIGSPTLVPGSPNPVPFPGPVPLALNLPAIASGATPFVLGTTIGTLSNRLLLGLQLSAAEREGRIRTLSSPRVATQDNEEAEIKQGTQVPFTTIDSSGRTVVSFQDAFIKLKVKPHITPDGRVAMKVEAERSFAGDRIDFSGGFAFPINTRKATTNILVPNGSTVVIGGLLQSTEQISEDRVPFLGQIPILGWLFKRHSVGPEDRVELLIFLTPSVLQESRV